MPSYKNTLLMAVSCLVLNACSSNEEVIEVSAPSQPQVIDIMNRDAIATIDGVPVGPRSLSNRDIEVFPFNNDGTPFPAAPPTAIDQVQAGNLRNYNNNPDVQIFSFDPAPVQRITPDGVRGSIPIAQPRVETMQANQGGDFVLINTPGQGQNRILFAHNSLNLDAQGKQMVQQIARAYKANPNMMLSVEGHASVQSEIRNSQERKANNLQVSMGRAFAVSRALIDAGIPAQKIRTVGWGEERKPFSASSPNSEASSRRVEILKYSGQ